MKISKYRLVGLFLSMLSVFLTIPCLSQSQLNFPNKTNNLRSIQEEKGLVKSFFSFENKRKSLIKITDVTVNCVCVKATWPTAELAPGDTGRVEVTYDPMNRPGEFEEKIMVMQDNGIIINLRVSGTVLPRMAVVRELLPVFMGSLQFQSQHVSFVALHPDKVDSTQYSIYNPNDQSYTINWDQSVFPGDFLSSSKRGKQLIPARDSIHFQLIYNASLRNDWNYVVDSLFISTNDKIQPIKKLIVSAFIHQRLSKDQPHAQLQAENLNYDFGKISIGNTKTKEFEISNTGKTPLIIRKISNINDCDCISVHALKDIIAPGESTKLSVSYTPKKSGLDSNIIGLLSNDPWNPYQIFRIVANIN